MGTETKQYTFKSVGKTRADLLNEPGRQTKNELPIGFKTPLQFEDQTDGLFLMHKSLINQVADNLKNLILTNSGERLIHTRLGGNILPLAFELGNEEIDAEIMARIKATVEVFMPYIKLTDFRPFKQQNDDPEKVAKLGFVLTFTAPSISNEVKAIEIFLDAVG